MATIHVPYGAKGTIDLEIDDGNLVLDTDRPFPKEPEDLDGAILDALDHPLIGPAPCVMSTDSGRWLNPVPVQQMGIYIQDMLDFGFSPQEIRTMVADNPARLLGL